MPRSSTSADASCCHELLDAPHAFIGSVDFLVDKIRGLRERYGISYFGVDAVDTFALAPVVERLAGT